MSNLVSVAKNGSLANTNSNTLRKPWNNWFDEFFDRDINSLFSSNLNQLVGVNPKVNIKESPDAFWIEMAVPGCSKSDFQIEVDHRELTVSSESQNEHQEKDKEYTRREFSFASFRRTFTLPDSVNDEKISANYTDGILKLHLPKKDEAKKKPARSIKIS
mgnify:CR=1 FL=1